MKRNHKIEVSFKDIFRKGTLTLLITFGAGFLFGKENMMIAFVLALGSGSLATQNLRIRTFSKALRLIFLDVCIVLIAYVAALNRWWAIPINLITLFSIIYLTVSPYRQNSYKTFMMLYVFCQYNSVSAMELPRRLMMVVMTVGVVVASIYIEQNKTKALLPPQMGKAFERIYKQLLLLEQGEYDPEFSKEIIHEMNQVADIIYGSSFRKYFTTYIGKVHFHFYLNICYLNLLLEQMSDQRIRQQIGQEQIEALCQVFEKVEYYFKRELTRHEVIEAFESYLAKYDKKRAESINEQVRSLMFAMHKSFMELEELPFKEKNKVYSSWKRSELGKVRYKAIRYFSLKSMSFNFAVRMSLILTLGLLLASVLGFYKFIWAIIPIMSITQPYVEDTRRRKKDRLDSNILAAVVLTILMNVIHIRWITLVILVAAFYLYYAYKDYYHASLFLTIISMCISSIGAGINTLFFYRIIYIIIGVTVVELSSRFIPYGLEDGISELVDQMEEINHILEEESLKSKQNQADLNRIREATIYSAILSQKLCLKNKDYQSDRIRFLINVNSEFVIRLSYNILIQ